MLAFSIERQSYLQLFETPERQTGVFAVAVTLACLWQVKAGILPELDIHILGLTAATLVLGLRLTLLAGLMALLFTLITTSHTITSFGNLWLFSVTLPVLFSYGLFLLVYRFLPHHFFVYVFVAAFISAGMTAAFKIVTTTLFFFYNDTYDWITLTDNYLYFSVIMWFPEAMLSGMTMTLLITYRPHWVKTFYDKEYLNQ